MCIIRVFGEREEVRLAGRTRQTVDGGIRFGWLKHRVCWAEVLRESHQTDEYRRCGGRDSKKSAHVRATSVVFLRATTVDRKKAFVRQTIRDFPKTRRSAEIRRDANFLFVAGPSLATNFHISDALIGMRGNRSETEPLPLSLSTGANSFRGKQ